MRQIGLEDAFDGSRRILGADVAEKLASERGVRAEAAADEHVITFDRFGLLIRLDFACETVRSPI